MVDYGYCQVIPGVRKEFVFRLRRPGKICLLKGHDAGITTSTTVRYNVE